MTVTGGGRARSWSGHWSSTPTRYPVVGLLGVGVDRDTVTVDSPVPVLLVGPDGVASERPAGRSVLALHPAATG